jgi:histidinol phosphatase-like enzyme (inositol monophosphatase family)
MPHLSELLEVATEAAWAAGRHTLAYFNTTVGIEIKADMSPVTQADKEAELICRRIISRHFPTHGIVGEEHGETKGTVPIRWIVDPIDGTKTFVHGVPLYGTLIGVEVEGEPKVGVIYLPALDEMVTGAEGMPALWNGRPCHVSPMRQLSEALVCTYDQQAWKGEPGFDRLVAGAQLTRTWADCYGYVLVATGRAEICLDPIMAIWDSAALLPVIESAGGRFTDLQGNRTIKSRTALATNGALHEQALSFFNPPSA